tara:strand:- start:44 stop:217 length:174 start_codon:yes stop_codon:yes gene_type:complete
MPFGAVIAGADVIMANDAMMTNVMPIVLELRILIIFSPCDQAGRREKETIVNAWSRI